MEMEMEMFKNDDNHPNTDIGGSNGNGNGKNDENHPNTDIGGNNGNGSGNNEMEMETKMRITRTLIQVGGVH